MATQKNKLKDKKIQTPSKTFTNPIRPVDAAFDRGQIPTITCVNKATIPMGVDFTKMVSALQTYVDKHLGPVWGVQCVLEIAETVKKGNWGMIFLDDSDVANALGYHELTPDGFPLSKIFVRTVLKNREKVSVTASHEIAEMLLDPGVQMCAVKPNGIIYAYEVADAPEAFDFLVDGVPMSDFVYPSWFEGFRAPKSTKFDHMGLIDRPFRILRGGYMSIFRNGGWSQIFGSKAAEKKFRLEDHPRAAQRYRYNELLQHGSIDTPTGLTPRKSIKRKP